MLFFFRNSHSPVKLNSPNENLMCFCVSYSKDIQLSKNFVENK